MTDISQQVADLIEAAFRNFKAADKADNKDKAMTTASVRAHAAAQIQAAQTIATLGLANDVRAVALLLVGSVPVGPSVELAREAFTAAAVHLGLVANEPDQSTLDDLRAALTGDDPADKDVEL